MAFVPVVILQPGGTLRQTELQQIGLKSNVFSDKKYNTQNYHVNALEMPSDSQ